MKIRKLLTLLLTVALLGSLFAAAPANAAAEHVIPVGDEVGTFDGEWNGTFDSGSTTYVPTATDGVPTGWVLSKRQGTGNNPGTGKQTNDVSKANDRTRSGQEGAFAYMLQNADGTEDVILSLSEEYAKRFVAGYTYKFSYWAKGTAGSFPGFKLTLNPFKQFYVGYQAPVNKTTWTYVEEYITIPENNTSVTLNMDMGVTWAVVDDLSILCMGIAKEDGANLIPADANVWVLNEATLSDGTLTLPAGASASVTVPFGDKVADIYRLSADIDASAVSDGEFWLQAAYLDETGKKLENIENTSQGKDFFFNRYVDYTYKYKSGAGKLYSTLYPAKYNNPEKKDAKSVTLTFVNASETGAVTLSGIALKETEKLIAEEELKGLPVYERYIGQTLYTLSDMPDWYATGVTVNPETGEAKTNEGVTDFRLIHPLRVNTNTQYLLTFEAKGTNSNKLRADYFIFSSNTNAPTNVEQIAFSTAVSTTAWTTCSAVLSVPQEFTVTEKEVTSVVTFDTQELYLRFRDGESSGNNGQKDFAGEIRNISVTKLPVCYNADGTAADTLENGKEYNVSVSHLVDLSVKDTTMVMALYDISGAAPKLHSVHFENNAKNYNSSDSFYANFGLAEDIQIPETGKYKLCVYTLDGLTGLKPVTQKFILK